MLLQLNIINFALIENLSINFDKGFNVFSGETGSGKSIFIDAINYVVGGKFTRDIIRNGAERTFVEAVFTIENPKTEEFLKDMGIEYEDLVIISRETLQNGKSMAKINGRTLPISSIKAITSTLIDIHGQHQNQGLLESSNHLLYLDYYGGNEIKELIAKYKSEYIKLKEIDDKLTSLKGNDGEREKLIDFYNYQIEELKKSDLKLGEDLELEERFSILSNAEKINMVLSSSYEILHNGSETSVSVYDSIGSIIRELKNIEKHSDKIKSTTDKLEGIYYNLEEDMEEIRDLKESIIFDKEELENINSRIYQISLLKKKYGKTIEEVLEYKSKIETKYEELIDSTQIIEKLEFEKENIHKKIIDDANKLNIKRKEISIELEKRIKIEFNYIGLEKSIFKIEVNLTDNYSENGMDKVQFLISTNPGEPLKPLEKIVSGGELSRIMLALKTVFIDKDKIPTVIFDEIDTGISGRIAQSVSEKMFLISTSHQVFCVTHLPQIACTSDVHYLIKKEIKNNNTFTNIDKISLEDKEYEIARLTGGAEVTKLTLEHAKEMISKADSKKKELIKLK
ncbi:MAG: DNA repair protein RecN [Bacillota bacterium]|nr:DNA repair protein RecN [Bacillota bacterium]